MINGYTLGNLTRTVAYEANRNLVNTVTNTWNASTISAFDYTNDAAGRRTNREDSGSAFASTLTNTFGYNSKSEVTSANMRNGTSSYTFDQIGNRIQVSVPDEPNPLDYTTNALNQYEETGAPTLLSAYDLDGNLTNDGKGTTFEWNAENRMVRVTTPTKVIENTFDAQGRRVRKQVFTSDLSTLTSDTRYFYDGWNLIYEDDVLSSTDTKYYVWGLDLSQSLQGAGGIGGLLLVKQGTTTWAPTYDANGNISEYIDLATGNETAHLEYDAFGRKIVASGSPPSTFGFSTKYEDVETGYLYYGFRFYDPVTGRWPNRDPIGEEGGLNLYGFVFNQPVGNFDVNGEIAWFIPVIIVAAILNGGCSNNRCEGFPESENLELSKIVKCDCTCAEVKEFIDRQRNGVLIMQNLVNTVLPSRTNDNAVDTVPKFRAIAQEYNLRQIGSHNVATGTGSVSEDLKNECHKNLTLFFETNLIFNSGQRIASPRPQDWVNMKGTSAASIWQFETEILRSTTIIEWLSSEYAFKNCE
jgi:RHS repeat-associated protein